MFIRRLIIDSEEDSTRQLPKTIENGTTQEERKKVKIEPNQDDVRIQEKRKNDCLVQSSFRRR